jgi:hypothetical protein
MGIFDKFKKKKNDDRIINTIQVSQTPIQQALPKELPQESLSSLQQSSSDDQTKLKIDLLLSEMNSLRTQIEMINERLKIIERKIDQKGTIRYV